MTGNLPQVRDVHGRTASYMRISVTDRCNLRCKYCMPFDAKFIPHDRVLRYEEIERLIGLSSALGVTKIRLTGGEPFVRKGFTDFLARVHAAQPDLDLRVTTNGTLLGQYLDEVVAAGVRTLNISLDTLRPDRFEELTGLNCHGEVLASIDRAIELGIKVKINVVGLKGTNDDELSDFIDFAAARDVDVRFIEFMPMGGCMPWTPEKLWKSEEILRDAQQYAQLVSSKILDENTGPVKLYSIAGGKGRIGMISPLSAHFCNTCNRLRITSTGMLRTCLYSDNEYRLRAILAHPKLGDEAVKRVIRLAGKSKPLGYEILSARTGGSVCSTRMSAIGG